MWRFIFAVEQNSKCRPPDSLLDEGRSWFCCILNENDMLQKFDHSKEAHKLFGMRQEPISKHEMKNPGTYSTYRSRWHERFSTGDAFLIAVLPVTHLVLCQACHTKITKEIVLHSFQWYAGKSFTKRNEWNLTEMANFICPTWTMTKRTILIYISYR